MLTFLVQLVKDVDLLQHILDNLCYRIEGKGKGILQHHQIIAEFEAIPEAIRKILAGGAFSEVLRSTQVTPLITHAFFFLLYPKFWEFSLTVFFFFYSVLLGSNCFASMGCPCCAPKAWCLGVRQSECPSTCC
jgi:hypothetical protein